MASNSARSGWDKGIPRLTFNARHDRDSAAPGTRAKLASFSTTRTAKSRCELWCEAEIGPARPPGTVWGEGRAGLRRHSRLGSSRGDEGRRWISSLSGGRARDPRELVSSRLTDL